MENTPPPFSGSKALQTGMFTKRSPPGPSPQAA
ncbi:hypothetical protein Bache_0419 [Bacteroides helcogenes P 36-108]|uniref:Uncharacterized protein n=1 Tax=Bacteroides helcogenes (strain ATCC 35417 / DSM 20613 / JCM 6297 / CCUG 15421 / P 36-108) TaxID=693979 RepID=E6SV10_BACT6|nr:hypothetical protein Bache_0419 [Bacteroides helcogenes P 36-108]